MICSKSIYGGKKRLIYMERRLQLDFFVQQQVNELFFFDGGWFERIRSVWAGTIEKVVHDTINKFSYIEKRSQHTSDTCDDQVLLWVSAL